MRSAVASLAIPLLLATLTANTTTNANANDNPRPEGGKAIVTVAASTPEFPRHSEGDSIELTDGRLLLVYMEFAGTGSDFAQTRLVSQESADGGRSWGSHRVITETSPGDMNVYSPNLIRAKDGAILLIFMRQHQRGVRTLHLWKSTDEGRTFAPHTEFFQNREFSLCNATVKRLDSGRLLLPSSPPLPGKTAERGPYAAVVLFSDDDGETWKASESYVELPMRGAMEPHVEQTADGRVLMVMRNQLGKLYMSESRDDGTTWGKPYASDLTTPESCPELVRIPGSADLLMIWNNTFDAKFRSHFGKRSPLTAAISKDHGKTWQHLRDIETDPKRAFSNPGCRFTKDGRAILNYWTCEYLPNGAMQHKIDLRVAVIDKTWFYDAPLPASDVSRPLPISAHNCYPSNSESPAKLEQALALGIDNIEIDLGWDATRRAVIVGHDASPREGVAYPEFTAYLVPALERHWASPREDGAPTVLTLDWKTDNPDAVRAVKAFLDAHPDWFSSAPKADESPMTTRRLTVCFTGSETAKNHYDAMVAPGEPYRAFRDTVFGAGGKPLDDVNAYGPPRSTAYQRFLTFHWGHVEPGAPARAGDWEPAEADRLLALTESAHRRGFRVRIYCVNGQTGPALLSPYRFASPEAAAIRWHAAAKAGVDWIASDEYQAAAEALRIDP